MVLRHSYRFQMPIATQNMLRNHKTGFWKNSKILRLDFCGRVPLFGKVGVRNVIFLFQKTDGSE